ANVALVKRITDNKRAPLLIYLTNSPVPDKATRQFSTAQLPTVYTAMAMIADRGLTKLIMNLLFRFQSPPIPMKNFTDVAEARAWLRQYL
ncbi:MAG: STAS/SEC14 domain-containing protein, partial [Caldilineaceae bacterium]|nr:STAS/SEC14 domain-containing protein [Caldilineaceae bacterium]